MERITKSWVLKFVSKKAKEGDWRIAAGSEFQTVGAWQLKERCLKASGFFRRALGSFSWLDPNEREAGKWQESKKVRVVMSRRGDDKPVLQFGNQFVQEWVVSVNAGAVVKRGLSLISSEPSWLHCFWSIADAFFFFSCWQTSKNGVALVQPRCIKGTN